MAKEVPESPACVARKFSRYVPGMVDSQDAPANAGGSVKFYLPKIRFPFIRELRRYSPAKLRADLTAGATLTLVSIPQAIGFALILGLPPMPVILSVMIGGFVGSLFFSSRYHVFGPTSSISLIVASTVASITSAGTTLNPLQLAVYMAFLIGVVQFIAGLLNFGEVTKFISRSVVIAYSSAIGIILVASQLHNVAGMTAASGSGFLGSLRGLGTQVLAGNANWEDIAVGGATFAIFWLVRRFRPHWPEALVTLAILAGGTILWAKIGNHLSGEEYDLPFRIIKDDGELNAGFPTLTWLNLSQEHLSIFPSLFGSVVAISIIGMLEAASITKSLAAKSGQRVEANQELMGMGAGNIACALFGAVPGSSSFTRSAVNFQCGAASQLSSMLSSATVLVVLLFVTPVFNYIPVAALAAHLIRVGLKMVVIPQIRVACRSTRSDAAVFAGTMFAALFLRIDIAIYVGIGISLALFLQKTSAPMLVEYTFDDSGTLAELSDKNKRANPQIAIIHVEGELFFGAADIFLSQVQQQASDENIKCFILRMKNARHLDASTVMALESLKEFLDRAGRFLIISGCTKEVETVLKNSGLIKTLGEENVFAADASNPNISTRRALMRASHLLAGEADIRIFYGSRKAAGKDGSKHFDDDPVTDCEI